MFCHLAELKEHVRVTPDELEFDRELTRALQSAENRVLSYLNRNVYAELPESPEKTDILINDSIKSGILDLAGYYFDNKGSLDAEMVSAILDSTVGHLKIKRCA